MGCEPGEGSKINGRRGPLPHPPVRVCPPGEKPLGGGGAFKTKKCGVVPKGRGWRGKRRRCGRGRLAARFPSCQPGGTPPTPSRGCSGAGEEGGGCAQRCFPVHFCRPGWGGRAPAPLPRVAAAHAPLSSASALSLWLGRGPSQPKCPKTRRALRAHPVAGGRASR